MMGGIQTLPQHQVSVCAKDPLDQLLSERIPPFIVHPPSIDQQCSQVDAEHMTPESLYANRASSLKTLHVVIKAMLYTPCYQLRLRK
jgi:hypothetical protein